MIYILNKNKKQESENKSEQNTKLKGHASLKISRKKKFRGKFNIFYSFG